MAQDRLAVHETLELSEILNFKNVCLTKNTVSQTLVSDPTLKSLLREDTQTTQQHIKALQDLLSPGITR